MINKIIKWFFSLVSPKIKEVKQFHIAFNKELNGLWYIDVPTWKGPHHNLLLVESCDDLMEHILFNLVHVKKPYTPELYSSPSNSLLGRLEFNVETSNEWCNNKSQIILEKIEDDGYGATYKVHNCEGFNKTIWICPVTLYVFGEYPKYIYANKPY